MTNRERILAHGLDALREALEESAGIIERMSTAAEFQPKGARHKEWRDIRARLGHLRALAMKPRPKP